MAQALMRVMGRGRGSFAGSPAAHLLLCGLVPNRLQTGMCPRPGGWGPLFYMVKYGHKELNGGHNKRYVHLLSPGICECDLFLKKQLCRCNEVNGLEMGIILDYPSEP